MNKHMPEKPRLNLLAVLTLLVCIAACVLIAMAFPAKAGGSTIFADGFESEAPVDPCAGSIPAGFTVQMRTWQQTWAGLCPGAVAPYPNSIGSPVPLKGYANTLTVTRWTPGVNESATITWDSAQSNSGACYRMPLTGLAMYVSISNCPGDIRPRGKCADYGQPGAVVWSTQFEGSNICTLEPGREAYMTVTPYDPDTLEFQCPPELPGGCDMQAVHRGL